jgi:putative oxidoreductase
MGLSKTDLGLLVGRMGFAGVLILRHGYPKIPALLNHPNQFFDPIGLGPTASLALAAFAEIVCAGLLALGLLGRLPTIPLVINFAVIVFPLHEASMPGDRGELAVLYLGASIVFLITGPGRYSLSAFLGRVGKG